MRDHRNYQYREVTAVSSQQQHKLLDVVVISLSSVGCNSTSVEVKGRVSAGLWISL